MPSDIIPAMAYNGHIMGIPFIFLELTFFFLYSFLKKENTDLLMKDLPNALLDKRGLSFDSAGQKTCKRSQHMPKLTNTSVQFAAFF